VGAIVCDEPGDVILDLRSLYVLEGNQGTRVMDIEILRLLPDLGFNFDFLFPVLNIRDISEST
jgi:hypothetical protein